MNGRPGTDRWLTWLNGPARPRGEPLGAKAENLLRLARAGQRVPAGFALSAGAYRDHLSLHGLEDEFSRLVRGLPDERERV